MNLDGDSLNDDGALVDSLGGPLSAGPVEPATKLDSGPVKASPGTRVYWQGSQGREEGTVVKWVTTLIVVVRKDDGTELNISA